MEDKDRSRRSTAIRIGSVAALMLVAATLAYRHVTADASSQGPLAPGKRERLDTEAASRGHGFRAPKPADTSAGRPAYSGPVTWDTGIIADDEPPTRDYVVRNRWGGNVEGGQVIVFAGALASDETQGVVLVQRVSSDGASSAPVPYQTSIRSGALHVTSVQGPRIMLATDTGTRFVFNLASLRFE